MHMDIFNDDAFSGITMSAALEDFDFKPFLIGTMNLFDEIPISTTEVSVERRGNTFELIPTTPRGAPLVEGYRDGRTLRKFSTSRIAKGMTLSASEIQNLRAFGQESDLETMISYVSRYQTRLIRDVEATWENMMLGAVQGVVLDADGSIIVDWFAEWGIPKPAEINFALDTATTNVEAICRDILRAMARKGKDAVKSTTTIIALCGDAFFDKLTQHKSVREAYLNTPRALQLGNGFGVAGRSAGQGSFSAFEFGGIQFINYRSVDDFDDDAAEAGTAIGKAMLGIPSDRCKLFPMGADGTFSEAFAPGESWEFVNTIGRPLYSLMVRDGQRDHWVRPEVYSYPLFMCSRPELLMRARAS